MDTAGRCHLKNESRLYCSNYFATTLIECGAEKETSWVVTEYEFKLSSGVLFLPLGIKAERFFRGETNPRGIKHPFRGMSSIEKQKFILANDYIRSTFQENNLEKCEHQYKRTVAITHYFERCDQLKGKHVGILFPSVASNLKGVNFAFSHVTALNVLKIKRAFYLKVKKIDLENGKIEISFLADGEIVNDKMIWKQNRIQHFNFGQVI